METNINYMNIQVVNITLLERVNTFRLAKIDVFKHQTVI